MGSHTRRQPRVARSLSLRVAFVFLVVGIAWLLSATSAHAQGIAIEGTLFERNGSTTIGAGKTIVAAVGTSTVSLHSTTTASDGSFVIEGVASSSIGTWATSSIAGNDDGWQSVTYGNGLFVAVANTGDRVVYSVDGTNWATTSAAGDDDSWRGVTYGNGLFVAVGQGADNVMTSPDGITWTARSAAGNDDGWRSVAYGNGLFVAVGTFIGGTTDRVMTSPDGINWTIQSAAGNDDYWTDVTYGNGLFVAVGQNGDRVMTSPDGVAWTARSAADDNDQWQGVTYGNGTYVAVGNSGDRAMYSTDGINWATTTAAGDDDGWTSVAYANGFFVAVGSVSGDRVMTSPDGITWTALTTDGDSGWWQDVAYGAGKFVAFGSSLSTRFMHADAGFGENTPITLFVDENATTSSTTATTLTYGLNADAGVATITVDMIADVFLVHKPIIGSSSNQVWLSDADQPDSSLDSDIPFTATTSTTTIEADFRITSDTAVFAPQNLVLDGDFDNQGTFYAERGELVADAAAYDITSYRYIASTSVAAQDALAAGVEFSSDGTKMYVVGGVGAEVNQYTLTIPWEVQTASFLQATTLSAYGTLIRGVDFSSDGTRMYTVDTNADDIDQYTLSTPWDVSTAAFELSTTTGNQDGFPYGVDVSLDGTKMFVWGNGNDDIYRYDLATPWDVSSASYVHSMNDGGTANEIYISDDGTQVFSTGSNVRRYILGTPWNLTTAGTPTIFTLQEQIAFGGLGLTFGDRGSYMYVTHSVDDTVLQYNLDDEQLFTGTFTGTSSLYDLTIGDTSTTSFLTDLTLDGDLTSNGQLDLHYSNLTLGRGTTSGSFTENYGLFNTLVSGDQVFTSDVYTTGLTIESGASVDIGANTLTIDGVLDNEGTYTASSGATVHTHSGGFDIDNMVYAGVNNTDMPGTLLSGLAFSLAGDRMYVLDFSVSRLREYYLDTPWDITTASTSYAELDVDGNAGESLFFKPDGTELFVIDDNAEIEVYAMAPWDLTTATRLANRNYVPGLSNVGGFWFKPDGTKMYVARYGTFDDITEYELSVPWDPTTASSTYVMSTAAEDSTVGGISFSPDGRYLYLTGYSGDDITVYSLSTPWDLSTESTDRTVATPNTTSGPEMVVFDRWGSRAFVLVNSGDEVYQYTIPTTWGTSSDGTHLGNFTNNNAGGLTLDFNASTSVFANNATFTAPSLMTVSGEFTQDGSFNSNSGHVYLDGSGRFNLSQAYVATTSNLGAVVEGYQGLTFKPDGTQAFMITASEDVIELTIYEFDLSSPWDIASATSSGDTLDIDGEDLAFNDDGTKLFVLISTTTLNEYALSPAYDITSTASTSVVSSLDLTTVIGASSADGITFSADGSKVYVITAPDGGGFSTVYAYNLSTPYDLSTASHSGETLAVDGYDLVFSNDGRWLMLLAEDSEGDSNQQLRTYQLSTPFDISTAVLNEVNADILEVPFQNGYGDTLYLHPDESRFYALFEGIDIVEFRTVAEHTGSFQGVNALNDVTLSEQQYFAASASATDITILPSSTITFAGAEYSLTGDYTNNADAGSTAFAVSTSTFTFNGSTQTATGTDINLPNTYVQSDVTFGSGAATMNGLTISSGASLVGPSENLYIQGSFTQDGSFDVNGATTTLGATNAVLSGSFVGANTFENLVINSADLLLSFSTSTPTTTGSGWESVTYGDDGFVAVGLSEFLAQAGVLYSADGITWSTTTAAGDNDRWSGVAYGSSTYVAVGDCINGGDCAMTSPDGTSWTVRTGPSGADGWKDVTYGSSTFVAVGSNGSDRAMTSPDGITWTARTAAGNNDNWQSVVYGEEDALFAAVADCSFGDGDCVMTSPDGITWTARTAPEGYWGSIAYGNGRFVAVGVTYGNTLLEDILYSDDGITWATTTSGTDPFTAITYGSGLFVGVRDCAATYGFGGVIAESICAGYSTDGLTWTEVDTSFGTIDEWWDVTYGDGKFAAVNFGQFNSTNQPVMVSDLLSQVTTFNDNASTSDLTVNTFNTLNASGTQLNVTGDFTQNGNFVASTSHVILAGNATQTATGTLSGENAFNDLTITNTSGNGTTTFAAVFGGDVSATGTFTITAGASVQFVASTTATFNDINWNGSAGSPIYLRSSENGTEWYLDVQGTQTVVDHIFVADSNATNTPGGIDQTNSTDLGNNTNWNGFAGGGPAIGLTITGTLYENDGITPIGAGKLIVAAVGTSTFSLHSTTTDASSNYFIERIATSNIGDWSTTTIPDVASSGNDWNGFAFGNGVHVAVSDAGTGARAMYSYDGLNWATTTTANDSNPWEDVIFAQGRFWAVANGGTNRLMYSENGIDWSSSGITMTDRSWDAIIYGDGQFVAMAGNCWIATSPDGFTWTDQSDISAVTCADIAYGDGRYIVVTTAGTVSSQRALQSSDGSNWFNFTPSSATGWRSATFGNGNFALVGDSNGEELIVGNFSDGWSNLSSSLSIDGSREFFDVVYGNGTFVVVDRVPSSTADQIYYSVGDPTNSENWTTAAQPAAVDWDHLGFGGGYFYGVDDDSSAGLMYTTAGLGEDTPITLFVDENATTSSTTATTLIYGINPGSTATTAAADLWADTFIIDKATGSRVMNLALADMYDNEDDADILFTATTSTTTVDADLRIASDTTVFAPQNLVIDGDFNNYGTFYAERGEMVANAAAYDFSKPRQVFVDTGVTGASGDTNIGDNGTKLYFAAGTTVYMYDLSVPYDLSTYSSNSSVNNGYVGVEISTDGTKMYQLTNLAGSNATIYEYDLSPAWDVSSASLNQSSSTVADTVNGKALSFSSDGRYVYMLDDDTSPWSVLQYSLSTPWDVSTLAYVGSKQLSTSGIVRDLEISANGEYMVYITNGGNGEFVVEQLSTPWDISTMSAYTTMPEDLGTPEGVEISPDGTEAYIVSIGYVFEYHLDKPQHFTGNFSATSSLWDLTIGDTATVSPAATTEVENDYHVGGSAAGPYAGLIELTGTSTLSGTGNFGFVEVQTRASAVGGSASFADLTVNSGATFYGPRENLTITGDFTNDGVFLNSGATTTFGGQGTWGTNISLVASSTASFNNPSAIYVTEDGWSMYVFRTAGTETIDQVILSEQWNIDSGTVVDSFTFSDTDLASARAMTMSHDGRHMYAGGWNAYLSQYDLSTPWLISTASLVATATDSSWSRLQGVDFQADGRYMIVVSTNGSDGYTLFHLSTPYDITTAVKIGAESDSEPGTPNDVAITPDGRNVIAPLDNNTLLNLRLSTPWDLSTMSTQEIIEMSPYSTIDQTGMDIAADGARIFFSSWSGSTIDELLQFDVNAIIGTSTGYTGRFHDVVFAAGGQSVFTGPASTTDFTIESAATVTAPASSMLTVAGDFVNSGIFTHGTGTLVVGPSFGDELYLGSFDYASSTVSGNYGVHFKPDGTKLFLSAVGSALVVEYDLSTPWDMLTASYAGEYSITNSFLTDFSPDGRYLFGAIDGGGVESHILSTPWDLSSASLVRQYASTTMPIYGMDFSPDGSKLFLGTRITSSGAVFTYNLSTPWEVSTSSIQSVSVYGGVISADEGNLEGIRFNHDGTQLYVIGRDDDAVNVYSLSTPWEVSTSSITDTTQALSYSAQQGAGQFRDLYLSPDQTKLVMVEGDSGGVYAYNIPPQTQVLNGSLVGNSALHDVIITGDTIRSFAANASTSGLVLNAGTTTLPQGLLTIAGDFTNNATLYNSGGTVYFSGSSQTFTGDFTGDVNGLHDVVMSGSSTAANDTSMTDFTIASGSSFTAAASGVVTVQGDYNNAGTFLANSSETVFGPGLGFDLSTAVYAASTSLSAAGFAQREIRFSEDGTRLYTTNAALTGVQEFDLSTPWDVSTASSTDSFTLPGGAEAGNNFIFSADGRRLYNVASAVGLINIIHLLTPWDLSTAVNLNQSYLPPYPNNYIYDLQFSPDGTKLYLAETGAGAGIFTYNLAVPWVISSSSASYSHSYNMGGSIASMQTIEFNREGTLLYVGDRTDQQIETFTLSIPWEVSTSSGVAPTSAIIDTTTTGDAGDDARVWRMSADGTRGYLGASGSGVPYNNLLFTFTLDETAQTATGTMTDTSSFANLTKNGTSELTFTTSASTTGTFTIASTSANNGATTTIFQAGASYTFQNIDWQGSGTTSELVLRSSASGTEWYLDVPGSQLNVEFVDVQDSNASLGNSIVAASSTDSGNNTNWQFGAGAQAWNPTDWTLYDTITIKHEAVDETLVDFPVYVDLADLSPQFWSTTPAGAAFTGTDIRITTDEDTPQELPRELVFASSTLQTGELHFKADRISDVIDTSFRIYYNGNTDGDYARTATYGSENVWSNDFIAVYHFQQEPNDDAGNFLDSTANQAHATGSNFTDPTDELVPGKLGYMLSDFNGTDEFIETSGNGLLNVDDFTVSLWASSTHDGVAGNGLQDNMIWQGDATGNCGAGAEDEYNFNWGNCNSSSGPHNMLKVNMTGAGDANFTVQYDGALVTNAYRNWTYVVNTMSNMTSAMSGNIYLNAEEIASSSAGYAAQYAGWDTPLRIGRPGLDERYYDGELDEVRISSTTRSAAWINAEYQNQSTTTNFYYLGAGNGPVGSTTISDHDATQVNNAFNYQNQTNEPLFAFKLTPESGNATITEVTIELRGAKDIDTSDFSNFRLYKDHDNDAAYDGSDELIASGGVMTLGNEGIRDNDQQGTLVFTTSFLSTTTMNYLIIADWNAPDNGSSITFDLQPGGLIATDSNGPHIFLGGTDHIQHNRHNKGGGGGTSAQVGGPPPVGDGDVGGGTNDGGELIGNDPDFYWPSAAGGGAWLNASNAYDQIDGTYANTFLGTNEDVDYSSHGFAIPATNVITGIEVKVEASNSIAAGNGFSVFLSWDGGTSVTASKASPVLNNTDTVYTFGGPSDLWGRTWSPSDFSDANFITRLRGRTIGGGNVQIDAIQVKIYHQATGGGGGGGGAI